MISDIAQKVEIARKELLETIAKRNELNHHILFLERRMRLLNAELSYVEQENSEL
jgi:hypothetical protein